MMFYFPLQFINFSRKIEKNMKFLLNCPSFKINDSTEKTFRNLFQCTDENYSKINNYDWLNTQDYIPKCGRFEISAF